MKNSNYDHQNVKNTLLEALSLVDEFIEAERLESIYNLSDPCYSTEKIAEARDKLDEYFQEIGIDKKSCS